MTSDTKIGLLLGLVFIFVIAFLINGLPSFRTNYHGNNAAIAQAMSFPGTQSPGIGAKALEVQQALTPLPRVSATNHRVEAFRNMDVLADQQSVQNDIRSRLPVPTMQYEGRNFQEVPAVQAVAVTALPPGLRNVTDPIRSSAPMLHKVKAGDSLASIAKEKYGSVDGNRKVNIDRIFAANSSRLSSPDALQVGQRLVIPPLSGAFETPAVTPAATSPSSSDPTRSYAEWYTVQEEESLWKIAERKLGNGNRYTEILNINQDLLSDPDSLKVGLRLRLPRR